MTSYLGGGLRFGASGVACTHLPLSILFCIFIEGGSYYWGRGLIGSGFQVSGSFMSRFWV